MLAQALQRLAGWLNCSNIRDRCEVGHEGVPINLMMPLANYHRSHHHAVYETELCEEFGKFRGSPSASLITAIGIRMV